MEVRNRQCRALTARTVIGDQKVLLAKPETFMNLSGISVRELVEEHEARPESDLIVIHDELDFPLGTLRIRARGSSAGHNGMKSIIGALGTQEFLRIRIGVAPERKVSGRRGVLAGADAQGAAEGGGRSARHRCRSGEGDFEGRSGGGDEPLQPQGTGTKTED